MAVVKSRREALASSPGQRDTDEMNSPQLRGGDTAPAKASLTRNPEGARDSTSRTPRLGSPVVHQRLLGVRPAAAYLGISHWTLRELAWSGQVAEVRLGRRLLFDVKDLDALIERNKRIRGVT